MNTPIPNQIIREIHLCRWVSILQNVIRRVYLSIHNHSEFELNFTEKGCRVQACSGEIPPKWWGDYDLVLITGKDLEHVWEQNECRSKEIREITIQFSSDLFFKSFINRTSSTLSAGCWIKLRKDFVSRCPAILKIYPLLDTLASEKQGFYAVIKFMTILYELSLFEEEADTVQFVLLPRLMLFHSDSRRVQKVQEYINLHYQEEIRGTVGKHGRDDWCHSAVSLSCVRGRTFRLYYWYPAGIRFPGCW